MILQIELDDSVNQLIWNEARDYLLSKKGVTNDIIEYHLNLYQRVRPHSINDVYRRLVSTLTNKQGVPNWIGPIENLEPFFENYSPKAVLSKYTDWEALIDTIQESEFEPPAPIDKTNNRNTWVHFTKGAIDGASLLSRFETVYEFNEFVNKYTQNGRHLELADYLSKKIHWYGFALSCDFLKELGFSNFVKPDTHINDIFHGLGLSKTDDDRTVFRAAIKYSQSINEIPYRVDKLFWLIGSGDFYLTEHLRNVKTDKKRFIKSTRAKLSSSGFEVPLIVHEKRKTNKKTVDLVHQQAFRSLIDLLTELRRQNKISDKEQRAHRKRWNDHENLRDDIILELNRLKDS